MAGIGSICESSTGIDIIPWREVLSLDMPTHERLFFFHVYCFSYGVVHTSPLKSQLEDEQEHFFSRCQMLSSSSASLFPARTQPNTWPSLAVRVKYIWSLFSASTYIAGIN